MLRAVLIVSLLSLAPLASAETAVPVRVTSSSLQPLTEAVPVSGSVTTARVATLSAEVQGRVASLPVEEGQQVEQGALLLTLDDELAQRDLDGERAEVARLSSTLDDTRRRLGEARTLIERRSIAASEVRSLEAEVAQADAALAGARASLQRREAEVRRHRLVAPFSGVISRRLTELGEWVQPGTGVLELITLQQLRADLQVPQRYYARAEPGSQVELQFEGHPGERFTLPVTARIPLSSQQARTFLLRIELPEDIPGLIPGMSVRGDLLLDQQRQGVAVSRDALLRHADGRVAVWRVVNEEGQWRAREQQVEPGLAFDGLIELREGLQAGEQVVVEGNESLREGQLLNVLNREDD
ncbi:efflux transporter periplasmic adaptor subunit [Pseudomonas abyssi]|jgi:RND family efflux transporter MFP subunit|uniref:Efflux transporter periplasmic adaptor subunit n=1 Tax=Pseudomonas abyssi TaxID=170540 RepID=A0A2A3MMN0_9PSED|nr:efflux RND transporter periplasmic adaptor subunit [Pseudomonas abyssi]MAC98757.1 efflux RND transporter periplasmic adaptor subunit [Pseudomonadales bacterium]PBK06033.1 efflux transporter periplasmic adaptor subunit [Pseudomonas abyssi]|tara:strand:- start:13864 stop:14931 length:1068 start_codon:yes stop_codon:yes gene_type:complete